MKLKLVLILMFSFSFQGYVMHPLKLSVGDIVYKDKKMFLKFKFFTDDLQATISQYCKSNIDLLNKGVDANTEKCIEKYIASKFQMSINGNIVNWIYKKSYIREAVVYVELEAKLNDVTSVKSVNVKNTLLFDVIAEQKNIINFNLFGSEDIRVLKFDNEKQEYSGEVFYKTE